jgi:hypothetical protein
MPSTLQRTLACIYPWRSSQDTVDVLACEAKKIAVKRFYQRNVSDLLFPARTDEPAETLLPIVVAPSSTDHEAI